MNTFDYRKIIDSFKARRLSEREIEQHLSELMLLFDFASSLNRTTGIREVADLLLLTVMGFTASRRAVFLLKNKEGFDVIAHRGYGAGKAPAGPVPLYEETEWTQLSELLGVRCLVPLRLEGSLLGIVGIGSQTEKHPISDHERRIIEAVVQLCAGTIQNALTSQTLQLLNRQLILRVYQLNTLFELSKEFNAVWDPESVFRILGNSLIGQLMVSRCAIFRIQGHRLEMHFVRGFGFPEELVEKIQENLEACKGAIPLLCCEMESEFYRSLAGDYKVCLVFPLILNEELRGLVFLGEKRNKKPYTKEDYDFIATLGNLALVADENARMQQQMIEKQRMEKELSIARQIQFSLLPRCIPQLPGYEISTYFFPAQQVGGDYFDFIPVSPVEVALAIGDVSGKSTPAALVMASLQASLRALASVHHTTPDATIRKINELLCNNQSQANKYVTFFYGILNHKTHELNYVNAGHCYPLILRKEGGEDRLETGGTVLGFFKDAAYKKAVHFLNPGDVMLLYTDGVPELISPEEEEFGYDRIFRVLRDHLHRSAEEMKMALVEALEKHRRNRMQWDDITFVLIKRL